MHPSLHAQNRADHPAIIMASTRETVTYRALDDASNRGAQLFRARGLSIGDGIAIWLNNNARFFEICWAAQRAGLYFTPISSHLTAAEAAYIINDCSAKLLVTTTAIGPAADELARERTRLIPGVEHLFSIGAPLKDAEDWSVASANFPARRIADEAAGQYMVYSSGTTGRPKGVRFALPGGAPESEPAHLPKRPSQYGPFAHSVYLSPAPLYHAAPLVSGMNIHRTGATLVILEKFTAEGALAAIEDFRVTHTQMVPTHFVRLLKLPEAVRTRYDHSSLEYVLHAAAPCPIPIKRQMMEWWGPIIHEYYSGSEAIGRCSITPEEWLNKPGSVGKPDWGLVHICGEDGAELGVGEPGLIYFEGLAGNFQYHNDAAKTVQAKHPAHSDWVTLGDIGYADGDGYVFLTDRKAFMIISGGVNIYPQEAENVLIAHPKVADAAVIGVPHEEMGEEVKAVVQPVDWGDATPKFAEELIAYCRNELAGYKCPRSVDFEQELPRLATGKLYKQAIRARYWEGRKLT